MPIPTKEQNETNEEYIERCMSDEFMKEYEDNDQRLAVCYAQLEDDEERHIYEIHISIQDAFKYVTAGSEEELEKPLVLTDEVKEEKIVNFK